MKTILRIFILSILFTSISFADIINVPADSATIQGGINLALNGDTVLVQPGTYLGGINFNGKNIVVGSLTLTTGDKSYISQTIIDGGWINVIFENGEDTTAVLCGFTITNGVGNGGACQDPLCLPWVGGIQCEFSSPTLLNLLVIGNNGGVALIGGSAKLADVTITGNTGVGLAISANTQPNFDTINRCNVYLNNSGLGNDIVIRGGWGPVTGFVHVILDTFTVLNPTSFYAHPRRNLSFDIKNAKIDLLNNDLFVSPDGNNENSGLSWDEPFRTISHAMSKVFADSLNPHTIHLANGSYSNGVSLIDYVSIMGESKSGVIINAGLSFGECEGESIKNLTIIGHGIDISDSNPVIKNVVINEGWIRLHNGMPLIEKVKISGREGEAAILMYDSNPILLNVEITNNYGRLAGGLRCQSNSHATLINCTISDNRSESSDVGGIRVVDESSLDIVNSIIWNNLSFEIGINESDVPSSTSIMVTNSLLKGGTGGIHVFKGVNSLYWLDGNINIDPMFVDTANGDYNLQEGSPCIDKGIQDTMIIYNDGQDSLYIPPMTFTGLAPDLGAYEYGDLSVIEQERIKLPNRYTLRQNYPNPFNPSTTIEFTLPKSDNVELKIYNILGKEVSKIVFKKLNSGNHTYQFDGQNLASGIYYYQLVAGEYQEVKKMILLK
jgi:hypothetical protein